MSDPDRTGPDLCSIRAVARKAEFHDTARGVLSADGQAFNCGEPAG